MASSTALGVIVQGTAWVSILLGFLLGSLAPALVGVVLLGFVEGARGAVTGAALSIERDLPERVSLDESFEARVHVRAENEPRLSVEDVVPSGLRVLEASSSPPSAGAASSRAVVLAEEPGRARFERVRVSLSDPWGMVETVREHACVGTVRVAPERGFVEAGRQAGRSSPIEELASSRHGHDRIPEVEKIREYRPGDRARDIDWARTSQRRDELMVRERERAGPRPVVVLLDATTSMRFKRRVSKLASASRVALGLAAAAEGAGVECRVVAFDESGIVRASTGGDRRIVDVLESLSSLSGTLEVETVPSRAGAEGRVSGQERAFLRALSPFVRGPAPSATPLESALALVNESVRDPSIVVAVLDAEWAPERARVAVKRLSRRGHDVALVAPATGAHHYVRREATGRVLEGIEEAFSNRETLRREIRAYDAPLFSLFPGGEQDAVEEVMAWTR